MESAVLTYSAPNRADFQILESPDDILPIQRIKNEIAIRLLRVWLADESGYDEKAWELVKKTLEENRLSHRKRFDD
jgi:hypothetical protein